MAFEEKWRKRWAEVHAFEAEPDARKKFFITFPYPYMNGYLHIGHFYTLMRCEALARYKRMAGCNVLFPQGWHCTGSPIENAARRVKEREEKQWKILRDMGFSDKEIEKFAEPEHWVRFFPKEALRDYERMGISIDPRRGFITTSLNPQYDAFVRWQFAKLKAKGRVVKGRHPVVWCPKENAPCGDHSRIKGEGETPQEFVLLKLAFEDGFLIAATLRPETVYGQTNLWAKADEDYVKARVSRTGKKAEVWYISRQCSRKLKEQEYTVEIIGTVRGKEMLGKRCTAPVANREIPILPSLFCDPDRGSGFVTSVPSDSPDDWIALQDLQRDKELCNRLGIDQKLALALRPIPIILSDDLGDMPAQKICEQLGVKSQQEREKLEEARALVYKKGFYTGKMTDACGPHAGKPVQQAKELIKQQLLAKGLADVMHEPSGEVVCRCLTPGIVKIVSDQWFLAYGDKGWKREARKALDSLTLYPEKVRQQFEHVLDWLDDWACTREYGLGTRLPWDERWLIESLSDSTLYMAYYTIAHLIQNIPAGKLDESFFDYVFLGRNGRLQVDQKKAEAMRAEFLYYYPVDFRNSGKDLVQNHLAFYLFNHAAVFEERHWPAGIGVNGWITVDGQKMSKSLGNMILLREMAERFGVDASRFTVLYGGEGLDDANWDSELARVMGPKLQELFSFCVERHGKGRKERSVADDWMLGQLQLIIRDTTKAMEETLFRSALQRAYFDLQNALRWYLRRTETPHKETISEAIEVQLLLLSPFTPFLCEEAWEKLGKKGLICQASWPKTGKKGLRPELDAGEDLVRRTLADIKTVLELAKVNPKEILLFTPAPWKQALYQKVRDVKSRNPGEVMAEVMKDAALKVHGKDISRMVPALLKDPSRLRSLPAEDEAAVLRDSLAFFGREFSCVVKLLPEEQSNEQKARAALPGKPAILVR